VAEAAFGGENGLDVGRHDEINRDLCKKEVEESSIVLERYGA
jgi:hypothetical protein